MAGSGSLLSPFFKEWFVHDMDSVDNPTYVGNADVDGNWYIMYVTGNTIRYATSKNHSELTYQQAWTDKEELTYGYIFG